MPELSPVDYAVPGFLLLIVIEMLWAARRAPEKYEPKDTLTSLGLGVGSTVAGALTGGLVLAMALWLYQHRVITIGWQWWAWIACFVLDDFNYYLAHRVGHRSRWFWASHVNHHSSQHYNLSTALRQTWTGFFAAGFAFRIWPAFIGFHPAMIATCGAINLIYQFWIHTERIGKLPRPIEFVFNTPSHHRVHHGMDPEYLDRNYGGILIIWDRMFGSFQPEIFRPHYGLTKPVDTFNIWKLETHEYVAIARDVRAATRLRDRIGYVFGPPGWSPTGVLLPAGKPVGKAG